MKKVLSVLLAGAMVAGMSVSAFAANAAKNTVYDGDGKVISVKDSGDVYAKDVELPLLTGNSISYNIDGVLPGITMYIPLQETMESKIIDALGKFVLKDHLDEIAAKATKTTDGPDETHTDFYLLNDGTVEKGKDTMTGTTHKSGSDYFTFTTESDYDEVVKELKAAQDKGEKIELKSLTNKDYFKFDVDKDEGSKYVSKVEVVEDKKLGDNARTAYLKFILNDSTTTSDLKSTGTITFKAKSDSDSYTGSKKVTNGDVWASSKTFTIDYTFWINNNKASNDDNIDTGDRVYFDPDKNEDNTLVWGDDRAALFFEGNDDGGKFYARLQTKSDSEIYSTYGDPVNADLWFFDFVGNPTVPSTSRATLTLGIPWDEDDDYTPKAEDCFIYEKDADGNLIDVTSKFTYSEDNDGTTEIPGWTIKTRTLGTYIISDTELDTTIVDEVEETEEPVTEAPASTGKEIPNTGSSDMVGAAVVAAVVSLAAAGAVAFKKASK